MKDDLVWAAKAINERGLVQAGEGNVSIRGQESIFITPTYNDYVSLTEKDIVELDMEGKKISGGRDASSEFMLHLAVYDIRPRAKCIIHTHSPAATALSVVGKKIPVMLEEMLIFLGGAVPVSEYGQANTDMLPKMAIASMGRVNGTLMANHGALVCARNVKDAVKMAELIEKMADVYLRAKAIGDARSIPDGSWELFLEKFEEGFATY